MYDDIAKLFNVLNQPPISGILDLFSMDYKSSSDDFVYSAQFFNEGTESKAKISVYRTDEGFISPEIEIPWSNRELSLKGELIHPGRDWVYNSILWFRETSSIDKKEKYEAFVSYLENYRDKFSVNLKLPLLSFTVTL